MYSTELCIIISQLLHPQLILTWGILYFFKSTFSMHFQHRRHPHISWSYTWRNRALSLFGAGSREALASDTVVCTTNLPWRFRRAMILQGCVQSNVRRVQSVWGIKLSLTQPYNVTRSRPTITSIPEFRHTLWWFLCSVMHSSSNL